MIIEGNVGSPIKTTAFILDFLLGNKWMIKRRYGGTCFGLHW